MRWVRTVIARRKIRHLLGHPNPQVRRLADGLDGALLGRCSPEEQEVIDRIERLRASVNASTDRVRFYYEGGRIDERAVGDIGRRTGQPRAWALVLFKLIRSCRPRMCLEMGTSMGISAAYQAAALTLNNQGNLVSLEGAPEVARLAEGHLRQLGLTRAAIRVGRFQDTLELALREHAPVDFAFVDGHHDEQATVRYFEQILPHLGRPALLIFDDIRWSAGMMRAWQRIATDTRLPVTIGSQKFGIALLDTACQPEQRVHLHFP